MSLTRRALAPLALSAAACRAPAAPPAMAGPAPPGATVPAVLPLLTVTVETAARGGPAIASARCFFAPGALPRAAALVGRSAALGRDVPVEVAVVAAHADGSARIALLSFALPAGAAPCEVAILAGHAEAGVPRLPGPTRA